MSSFYQHLVGATAAEEAEFRAIPIIATAVTQGVDLRLYLDYLACAYHHVRHTCPLLGLALSQCRIEDGALRAGLLAYIDEEQGHEAWILDDIAALGGNPEDVAAAFPPFAVRMMVAYAYHAVQRISPYAMLGMVHVLEGMSVALARAGANAIRQSLDLEPSAAGFRYLTSHGDLDEDHIQLFAALLGRVDTPANRTVVVQSAKDFYRLYGDVFRALAPTTEVPVAAQR